MLRKRGNIKTIKQDQLVGLVPQGQHVTEKFPVLTYGSTQNIPTSIWRLRIFGMVENDVELDWGQFMAMPQTTLTRDFHCVTQWSHLNNDWDGVLFRDVLSQAKPKPEARFVLAHCYGGYTTNLSLSALLEDDVLFAHKHNGMELEADHGGPVRLVVPSRYGWKSAKWVNALELLVDNKPGFWERLGYHDNGDPWKEERFRFAKSPDRPVHN
jgi:DMSO/TMAO reductase YedYZ molybdopterin-dependent catalytic subunit